MTTPNPTVAPTVELAVGGWKHVVVFDFDRLVAIEGATGRTVLQTLSEFAGYAASGEHGQEPTEDQRRAAAERFSLTTVGKFVAGCLGDPPAEIGKKVQLGQLRDVFLALVPGFVAAVQMLNGTPEPAADPTRDPQASGA